MPFFAVFRSQFLSTLSLRRATDQPNKYMREIIVISIHALLAESDLVVVALRHIHGVISIHALLAESDPARSRL